MPRTTNTKRSAALKYARRGWRIFPLDSNRGNGKNKPCGGMSWNREATSDSKQIKKWWKQWPDANIGMVCGVESGVVVLDLDGPNGEEELEKLGLSTGETLEATSGKPHRRHLYFSVSEKAPSRKIKVRPDLDILGEGGYVVLPPSVSRDESGKQWEYRWLNTLDPLAFPRKLLKLKKIKASRNGDHAGTEDHFTIEDPVIRPGERDNRLASIAGSLRRQGMSPEVIASTLRAIISDPSVFEDDPEDPISDEDINRIAGSIGRYPAGPEIENGEELAALNERFAVVMVGGKLRVLEDLPGGNFRLMTSRDFHEWLLSEEVLVDDKMKPLSKVWFKWDGRRRYEGIGFFPGVEGPVKGVYNVWKGWGVVPQRSGSCKRFLSHLEHVVCAGNREHYEWLLDWFAHIFQRPTEKLGIAIALRGPQGSGKSIVGDIIGKLLGQRGYTVVADAQHVTGRFNAHIESCLLLQAEEAFWAGSKSGASALKHLVTGQKTMMERKGIDALQIDNYTRLLITSNEDWVWPADLDDRRLVIFQVAGDYKQNKAYFRKIFKELDDGGYERLMYELTARKIDRKRLTDPPVTDTLLEQAIHSMEPHEQWLYGVLEEGHIPAEVVKIGSKGHAHVPIAALYDDYVDQVRSSGWGRPKTDQQLGLYLRSFFPQYQRGRRRSKIKYYSTRRRKKVQSHPFVFPKLEKARQVWSSRGRASQQVWGKKSKWTHDR